MKKLKDLESMITDEVINRILKPTELFVIHALIAEYFKSESKDKPMVETVIRAVLRGMINLAKDAKEISNEDYEYIFKNYVGDILD